MAGHQNKAWHSMECGQVLHEWHASEGGLTAEEAAARLARHGPNRLPAAARQGPLRRFLRHFHHILIYVLLGSAAITAALGHLADTLETEHDEGRMA